MSGGEPSSIKRRLPSAAVKPASVRKAAQPRALPAVFCSFAGGEPMYRALYRKWRPQRFADVVGRRPSSRPCRTRFLQGASAMRICSPAPAAPARRPAPRSLPRRSTVWTPPALTPAASVKFVRALTPVPSWTSSRWMPRRTTVLTTSATCATRWPICRQSASTRSTLSTRCTCSPPRRSTRCSKRWRNRPSTSSLS